MGTTHSLHEATSDKSSPVLIQESTGDGVANIAWGNPAPVIAPRPKNTPTVPCDSAQSGCSNLVSEKQNMDCSVHVAEVAACSDGRRRMNAVRPQLLFPVDDVEPLLSDNAF